MHILLQWTLCGHKQRLLFMLVTMSQLPELFFFLNWPPLIVVWLFLEDCQQRPAPKVFVTAPDRLEWDGVVQHAGGIPFYAITCCLKGRLLVMLPVESWLECRLLQLPASRCAHLLSSILVASGDSLHWHRLHDSVFSFICPLASNFCLLLNMSAHRKAFLSAWFCYSLCNMLLSRSCWYLEAAHFHLVQPLARPLLSRALSWAHLSQMWSVCRSRGKWSLWQNYWWWFDKNGLTIG